MNKERMKELLTNLVKSVKDTYTNEETIKILVNDYGFEGVELVREFGFLRSDVERVTGDPIIDKISVSVYRDTCDPGFKGDDNVCAILVDRDDLKRYFRGFAAAKYTDKLTTDNEDELFEKWLDEYTCDDTDDLYVFVGGRTSGALKSFFTESYFKKHNELYLEADRAGVSDASACADESFADEANADEIAGYYITIYGDDALKTWLKNQSLSADDRDERFKENDTEVTRILSNLYGTGCYGAGSYECLNGCTGCDSDCGKKEETKEVPWNEDVCVYLDVKIPANAKLLLDMAMNKNGYDIKKEVKNVFKGVSYYYDEIRREMEERDILSEYIDLFDCSDPEVIVDKYCTVFTDEAEFDYAESILCNDRSDCYFTVPVHFNLSKYIRYMDQGEGDVA